MVYASDYKPTDVIPKFEEIFDTKTLQNMVTSKIIEGDRDLPPVYLEFRLWKQGRVNIDNLSIKLRDAISQATRDLVMEYLILTAPLCEERNRIMLPLTAVKINTSELNLAKEVEFNCILEVGNKDNIKVVGRRKLETIFSHRKRVRRVNPPTSKTTRSITFDDYERDKELYFAKMSSMKPLTKLNSFETGDDGILCNNYSKYLPGWLEFGSTLLAPSVRKQKITLTNYHLPGATIKELLSVLQDTPKAFRSIPLRPLCEDNDEVFVPHDPKKFVEKCVIISRNFDNWKASTAFRGTLDYPDFMSPHSLKHTQKFVPAAAGNKFIPRQKILWILIQSDSVSSCFMTCERKKINQNVLTYLPFFHFNQFTSWCTFLL